MRIIFDRRGENIETHARNLIRMKELKNENPRNVAIHSAQVPDVCGDCGETYWHRNDEYGWFPHIGCKGESKGVGF